MIALWGVAGDRPLAAVHRELVRHGHPVVLLDQLGPVDADVEVGVSSDGPAARWANGAATVDLTAVRAWYARPYDTATLLHTLDLRDAGPQARRLARAQEALAAWWSLTDAVVVNPPQAMSLNGSKPHQLTHIAAAGFRVPTTLVTNDPERALGFVRHHQTVIYKSVSSVRSRVAVVTPERLARFADLRWCPTQFQEWVPGEDVRVHVVADEVFATAIRTSAVDYRYPRAGEDPQLVATRLPDDVAQRCRVMARDMQLPFAGIDLRRTPGGDWFCFEVNPSPGFTFYESATGQPIAAAVARLLAAA